LCSKVETSNVEAKVMNITPRVTLAAFELVKQNQDSLKVLSQEERQTILDTLETFSKFLDEKKFTLDERGNLDTNKDPNKTDQTRSNTTILYTKLKDIQDHFEYGIYKESKVGEKALKKIQNVFGSRIDDKAISNKISELTAKVEEYKKNQ
jgi:hypothetical protein